MHKRKVFLLIYLTYTTVCSGHAYIFILEKYSKHTTYYSERISCARIVISCARIIISCARIIILCERIIISSARIIKSCSRIILLCARIIISFLKYPTSIKCCFLKSWTEGALTSVQWDAWLTEVLLWTNEPPHDKMTVCPAKTQISLGRCPAELRYVFFSV